MRPSFQVVVSLTPYHLAAGNGGRVDWGVLFLAAVGLSFLFLGVETHGRAITVMAEPEAIAAAAAKPR
jgi:hypothetical protein